MGKKKSESKTFKLHRCRGRHVTDGHHACGKVQKMLLVSMLCLLLILGSLYTAIYGGEMQIAAPEAYEVSEVMLSNETAVITLAQDDSHVSGNGAVVDSNTVYITKGGVYRLTGTLEEGQISIDAGKKQTVILILDGVSITNAEDAAIYSKKCANLVLYLEDGTENVIISGTQTEISADAADDDASGGALTLKANTTVTGTGTLTIYGYLNNGLHCSKYLFLEDGNLIVTAVNNGIKGNQGLTVDGGNIQVLSGNDALKSGDSGDDEGVVTINGGTLTITSCGDGIQAENLLTVNGGDITITTTGDDIVHSGEDFGMMGGQGGQGGFGGRGGFQGGEMPDFENMSEGDFPQPEEEKSGEIPSGMDQDETTSQSSDSVSNKGLKSHKDLVINGGTITIDSVDDSVHCDGEMIINVGNLTLSTQDDGIHADVSLVINGGTINVLESYEGIESNQITINDGDISVVASDDGFNANGGSSNGFGMGGFGRQWSVGTQSDADEAETQSDKDTNDNRAGDQNPQDPANADGQNTETQNSDSDSSYAEKLPTLTINGGSIFVNASGDGLDSNGDLIINGGTIIVDGPSSSGNGALDCGSENGGTILVNGGTLLAIGSSGMAEVPDEESDQYTISATTSFAQGTEIAILAEDGTMLLTYTALKSGQSVIFSDPALTLDSTYIVQAGDAETGITVDSKVSGTTSVSGFGGMGGDFMGGKGNRPDQQQSGDAGMIGQRGERGNRQRPEDVQTESENP